MIESVEVGGLNLLLDVVLSICVQGSTIEVRNAHLNGAALNANWYQQKKTFRSSWYLQDPESKSAEKML